MDERSIYQVQDGLLQPLKPVLRIPDISTHHPARIEHFKRSKIKLESKLNQTPLARI